MQLDQVVGQRIAKAREFLGLTQAAVALRIGLARTTQVAIEQGHRAVSVSELQRYGEILGRPLNYFFGEGVWSDDGDLRAVFRQIGEKLDSVHVGPPRRPGRPRGSVEPPSEKRALLSFEALCRQQADLQRLNRLPLASLPDLPAPAHQSGQEAELLAATVRVHLDLGGEAPLHDLRRFLEQAFGVSVFVMEDTGRLAGAAFRDPRAGACVLLARAPATSLRFELALALCHLLSSRGQAFVRVAGAPARGAGAAFASAFAGSLLVPARGLRERYLAATFDRGAADAVALVHVARTYGVSVPVLCARLRSQRLPSGRAPRRGAEGGAGASGQERGPAPVAAGDPARGDRFGADEEGPASWTALPERYVFLALRAYRRGLIDAARLAECLLTTPAEALARLSAYERDVGA